MKIEIEIGPETVKVLQRMHELNHAWLFPSRPNPPPINMEDKLTDLLAAEIRRQADRHEIHWSGNPTK